MVFYCKTIIILLKKYIIVVNKLKKRYILAEHFSTDATMVLSDDLCYKKYYFNLMNIFYEIIV